MENNPSDYSWNKLKRNLGFYFSRVVGRPLCPPEHVYFSLTNRCNLKCKMCSIPGEGARSEEELSLEQCKRIIDQIADLGVDHLIFSGGEPLLRRDIEELVHYAVLKKIKMVDLISNGLMLTEAIGRTLVNAGLTHITISIDGREEAHDFVRGEGAFKRAVGAIDMINRIRGDRTLPTVGINFTIMDCNIDDIVPMIEVARSKKCNIIVIQPMLSDNTEMQDRVKNELWVSERNLEKLRAVIGQVLELKRTSSDLSVHVNEKVLKLIPDYFSGTLLNKDLKCYEGFARIVISFTGGLWTCQGMYGELKTGTLKQYWFSKRAGAIRKKVVQCRTPCLQSCVHMEELSDIYPACDRFVAGIADEREKKEYLRRLCGMFKSYRALILWKKCKARFGRMLGLVHDPADESLDLEIARISESLRGFEQMISRGRVGRSSKNGVAGPVFREK
ncbi:MAG: radical SAM protein [Candidatus Omnitrophota bacterium]